MRKIEIHFEIGRTSDGEDGFSKGETYTVYRAGTLSECVKEFKEQNYNIKTHFIDIWETEHGGTPYPITHVNLDFLALEMAKK